MPLSVALPVFDGPLDLLLHLIEKNKVSIFDIPIVEITDQYLAYVRKMETEDLGLMSEFMVMAAELISIKCKMLLPPEVDEEGEEIDPRKELVQQLLEYKMYKYMSYELRDRMDDAAKILYKGDTTPREVLRYRPKADPEELLADLTLKRLHEIFGQVLRRQESRIDPVRSQFGTIKKEEVSLEDKLLEVADLARRRKKFSFRDLLKKQKSRMQTIVAFLAMLELMKYGIVEAEQEETGGEILIRAVPGADLAEAGLEAILAENEPEPWREEDGDGKGEDEARESLETEAGAGDEARESRETEAGAEDEARESRETEAGAEDAARESLETEAVAGDAARESRETEAGAGE